MHRTLCTIPLLAALALHLPSGPAAAAEIRPLAEIEPGQRGYGLSVFKGSRPERFEVEVLGVWRRVRPDTSYILARLSGRGLEETGVVAGMSGSPVYIDGALAGAVAFAWPFAREAIAGITPIETMRELIAAGPATVARPRGSEPFDFRRIVRGDLDRSALVRQLALLRSEPMAEAAPGIQWSTVGFGELSRGLLGESLGGLSTAGITDGEPAAELAPGSSISGVLVDGDLRLAATGTVTDRLGDELLAFGHAFMGLGPVRLPMATSEVITVLPSTFSSFKVANVGPVVGAFDFDHSAGIRGRVGALAPMLPLRVGLNGASRRQVDLRLADLPLVTPALVAVSVLAALEASPEAAGVQAIDLTARFELGADRRLEISQSFDGANAPTQTVLHLFAITGFLLQNRLEEVEIGGIEVDLRWWKEPRVARIVGAHAARTLVQPGERVPINVDLMAYRGEPFRRALEIQLPTSLPDGTYSLLVGDGLTMDVARLTIERFEPVKFRQALRFLDSLHSRRELVVLGVFPNPGLAVAGEVLPRLPGSVISLWRAAASGSAVPLQLAVAQQEEMELEVPVEGVVRIDLRVERREPWGAEGTEPGAEPVPADDDGGEIDAAEGS